MATTQAPVQTSRPVEDPLAHLPCSTLAEYRRGQMIYDQDQPSTSIYLVIDGVVKVSRLSDKGHLVLIDIYRQDDLFGESALWGHSPRHHEQAVAMQEVKLMTWTAAEINDIIARRPRLAIALVQLVVQRSIDSAGRLESFSIHAIERRLARSLIRFAERLGSREEDGTVHMMPLTHELLAQYLGTSREVITQYMNRFSRAGYIQYSRKEIVICPDGLSEWRGLRA